MRCLELQPMDKSRDDPRRQEVTALVYRAITNILPGLRSEEISGDQHLEDLGADSVDRVEIVLSILHRMGLSEPMASFAPLKNIDALIDFLCLREPA